MVIRHGLRISYTKGSHKERHLGTEHCGLLTNKYGEKRRTKFLVLGGGRPLTNPPSRNSLLEGFTRLQRDLFPDKNLCLATHKPTRVSDLKVYKKKEQG